MRVLFAGSPGIAVPSLARVAAEHDLVGVLTNPEAPCGRGLECVETPVAQLASSLASCEGSLGTVPVLCLERLGAGARQAVAALRPEILVSFAYGRIFGPRFLALFPRGGVNVHPSLLPRHRGPAPLQAAILARDAETGVSVQRLALEVDSGDILGVERIGLSGRENAEDLAETAALVGAGLLSRVLAAIESGTEVARPQVGEPTWCTLLRKEDGLVDWAAGALDIDARVRAFTPWPGAFTLLRGQRLAVLESFPWPGAAFNTGPLCLDAEGLEPGTVLGLDKGRGIMVKTIDGLVALRRLQIQHKKALPYREFANGIRGLAGTVLGR